MGLGDVWAFITRFFEFLENITSILQIFDLYFRLLRKMIPLRSWCGLGNNCFKLHCKGIDQTIADSIDFRSVLFLILLILLLASKLPSTEHLQPTFIAKLLRAELYHKAIDLVVRWDIAHELAGL